jgi:hypothetical protein
VKVLEATPGNSIVPGELHEAKIRNNPEYKKLARFISTFQLKAIKPNCLIVYGAA